MSSRSSSSFARAAELFRFASFGHLYATERTPQPGDVALIDDRQCMLIGASGSFTAADSVPISHEPGDGWLVGTQHLPDDVDALAFCEALKQLGDVRFDVSPSNCAVRRLVGSTLATAIARWGMLRFRYAERDRPRCSGVTCQFARVHPNEDSSATYATTHGESETSMLQTLCRTSERFHTPEASPTIVYFGVHSGADFSNHLSDYMYMLGGNVNANCTWNSDTIDHETIELHNAPDTHAYAGIISVQCALRDADTTRESLASLCAGANSDRLFAVLLPAWPVDSRLDIQRNTSALQHAVEAALANARQPLTNADVLPRFRSELALWLAARGDATTRRIACAEFRQPHQHRVYRDLAFAMLQATALPAYCVLWVLDWFDRPYNWRLTHFQRIGIIASVAASMRAIRAARKRPNYAVAHK